MIADPIEWDYKSKYFNYPSQTIFIRIKADKYIGLCVVGAGGIPEKYLWSILNGDYFIDGKYLNNKYLNNKEEFLDKLREKYPEYFEWLLWNGDCLDG